MNSISKNSSEIMKTSSVNNLSLDNMSKRKRSFRSANDAEHHIFNLKTPCSITRVVDWIDCHLQVKTTLNDEEAQEKVDELVDQSIFFRYDLRNGKGDNIPSNDSQEPISVKPKLNPSSYHSIRKKFKFNRHIDNGKRNGGSHFSPSTADKKKELCNYLKLMNHTDKPVVHLSKFRRSKRVKNLEQKEKEKKQRSEHSLSDEDSDVCESLGNLSETFTSKSFNDLSMIIDTYKYPNLMKNERVFNFIMPPKEILKQFNDFQLSIEPLFTEISKEKHDSTIDEITNGFNCTKDNNSNSTNADETKSNKSGNLDEEKNLEEKMIKIKKKDNNNSNSQTLTIEKRQTCSKSLSESRTLIDHDYLEKCIHLVEKEVRQKNNGNVQNENIEIIKVNYHKNEDTTEHFNGYTESEINVSQEIDSKLNDFVELFNVPTQTTNIAANDEIIEIEDDSTNDEDDGSTTSETSSNSVSVKASYRINRINSSIYDDHDYYENEENVSKECNILSPSEIVPRNNEVHPFKNNGDVEMQTLQNLLKHKVKNTVISSVMNATQDWDSEHNKSDSKTNSHSISINRDNGAVTSAIYVDFNLLLVQELAVSMWNQTALGNILGAQNLWLFQGCTKKLIPNKECISKNSLETVMSTGNCVAYVELWTKEHKSEMRERPVADVFATVYFWIQKLKKMDRKALQLENIKGFADDVQYVVLKTVREIVVSWHSGVQNNKVTQIHVYTLAADFQSIINGRALAKVDHYVSSLHNIEDCEDLLMGCGEHKITLWNLEHGYIVTSIELTDIELSLSTNWVRCDRGYLFTLQQCVDRQLRLIAINGKGSWKQLKSYLPSGGFGRIKNVYIENGILISFYAGGILCWEAHTGEQIMEEVHNESDVEYFSSGKYLIIITEKNVVIRHAITHFLLADD